jgi:4-hydroxythreonine-4-phosphate dehydrogenase
MGDPAGIGLDVTLFAWLRRADLRGLAFALFGDVDALLARARRLGVAVPIQPIASVRQAAAVFTTALPVMALSRPGLGQASIVAAIEEATQAVVAGEAAALVTNPITKRALAQAELAYPGHTEFLAVLAQRHWGGVKPRPVMMLVSPELKVVPATVHIPLASVSATLTRQSLAATIRITAVALTRDFGIDRPRLAVAGLNPHAGEAGMLGREEAELIAPVVAELAAEGLAIFGPRAADTLFHAEARATYDAAIAMYHDQALIPIKTLAFDSGVNVTLGLPFVRTSPDHGTAFAIAGTGKARPDSLLAALNLAGELARRRALTAPAARP